MSTSLENGIFLVKNRASGRYLNIWGTDQVGNNRNVCQYDLLAELNQLFWVHRTTNGTLKLRSIIPDENKAFYALNINGSTNNCNLYKDVSSNDSDSGLAFEAISNEGGNYYRVKLATARSNGTYLYLTAVDNNNGSSAATASSTGNVIWAPLNENDQHQHWDFEFMVNYLGGNVDIRKLDAQVFLHKFYGSTAPIDAKAGTVLCRELIKALQQILLGDDCPTSEDEGYGSFGPATFAACPTLSANMAVTSQSKALMTLFCHAMFCKGYTTVGIYDTFNTNVENGVKSLQRAVGLAQDGRVVPELLKAVFNTDSYVLSNKGDAKIREIQQALNGGYYQYTGINPCDGIYSRATNRALIYALQKEEGMSVDEATGSFLDRTFALCPTIPFQGSSSLNEQNITKIVQYALYANGFYTTGAFDGTYNASMSASIREFQAFMVLPVHDYANPSTIKALMASCGDVNRSCEGCDTATILTSSSAAALYQAGYRYVGRYLTGTVGGTRSKALTLQEAYTILDAGMKIIPIYQDGATYADYFTESRAFVDADAAYATATALGLPSGTTVYFAVDVDLTDYQIQDKLIDYFDVVYQTFFGRATIDYQLHVGVYGTRNVCQQIIDAGYASCAYVSDMSTGYSGNLGFKIPSLWAFDQFHELKTSSGSSLPIDIDKVAVSGRDQGVSSLLKPRPEEEVTSPTEDQIMAAFRHKFTDFQEDFPILREVNAGTLQLNRKYVIINHPNIKVDFELSDTHKIVSGEGSKALTITWDGATNPNVNIASALQEAKNNSEGYGLWNDEPVGEGIEKEDQVSFDTVLDMLNGVGFSIKKGTFAVQVTMNPVERTLTVSTISEIPELVVTPNYSTIFSLCVNYTFKCDSDGSAEIEGYPSLSLDWAKIHEIMFTTIPGAVDEALTDVGRGICVALSAVSLGATRIIRYVTIGFVIAALLYTAFVVITRIPVPPVA